MPVCKGEEITTVCGDIDVASSLAVWSNSVQVALYRRGLANNGAIHKPQLRLKVKRNPKF